MQTNGSLTETNLRSLLESAQTERATGTLTLRDGNGSACTLYFLFGHLFHAVGDGILGDEAVVRALRWNGGDFDFDAKAKLPADETVRGSIGDLVAQADKNSTAPAEAAHAEPEAQPEPEPEPEPEPAAAAEAQPEAESTTDAAPAPEAAAPEPEPEPAPQPTAAPAPEPARAAAGGAEDEAPQPRRGVKHRPQPKHGREPIPVPAGQVIYDSLKTSFVDFPRLITTLEREAYTGYVRLLTDSAAGLILFKDGSALECAYDAGDEPSLKLGRDALIGFNDEVTNGQGVLDVVSLSPELVDGLHQLTVAHPLYSDLYASWVDSKALLKFLESRKLSGSVMVRSGSGTGVIILTDGRLTGAYTTDSRDISDSAEGVLALCKDSDAVIEVKAADPGQRPPLDVDAIVGSRRIPSGTTQVGIPVYRPEEDAAAAPAPAPAPGPAPATPPPLSAQEIPVWQPAPPEPAAQAPTNPTQPVWQPDNSAQSMPTQQVATPAATRTAVNNVDWEIIVTDLQGMTEDALGNRARKVKDVLGSADRSPEGLESAIQQVPTISILFVDSSRLEALANDLRAKLHSYLA